MVVCGFLSSQTSIYNPELSVEYTQRRLYKLLGLNSWQWLFMIVSLIQIGTIGGLTYYQFEQNDVLSSSLVINIIISVIIGFGLVTVSRGIFFDRQYDVRLYMLMMLLGTFYIAIEFLFTIEYQTNVLKMVRLIISSSLTIFLVSISKMIHRYSHEYEIVGVSNALIKLYQTQTLFLSLLNFDLLLGIILSIFNLSLRPDDDFAQQKYTIMIIVIIYSFFQWVIGKFAVIKEIKCLVLFYVILYTASLLWTPLQFIYLNLCFTMSCTLDQLLLTTASLMSAFIILINRILIHIQMMKVHRNFGYGLADQAFIDLVDHESSSLLFGQRSRRGFRTFE